MIDLIRTKTRTNLEIANQQLRGWLYKGMAQFKAQTIEHLDLIEAHIDFPEEEIEPMASGELKGDLERSSTSEVTDRKKYLSVLAMALMAMLAFGSRISI